MTDSATRAQNEAARPHVSTWLTANAGSGKTRVLTDRVARLLLRGVRPQNILCLTYTKAAASEMQNRLFQTLGKWAMLPDVKLVEALTRLGEVPPDNLGHARTLFASAVEAPGGLKIQTIHSLCSTILRQFPLEAGINPNFREMDERLQTTLLEECLSHLAQDDFGTLQSAATAYSGDLVQLAKDVVQNTDKFGSAHDARQIYEAFGLSPELDENTVVQRALDAADLAFLKSLAPVLTSQGGVRDQELGEAFLRLPDRPNLNTLKSLEKCLLFGATAKTPFKAKFTIPGKPLRVDGPLSPVMPEFTNLAERIEAARDERIALTAAQNSLAIQEFAAGLLAKYEKEKAERGLLDFDDLIRKTKVLLSEQSLAWVRYKLDARIDHVLVDEAQDTSPMQWDVIEALADEMMTGQSDRERTLFVVGDKKQSIYSFQGADAKGFDKRGKRFRRQMEDGPGMTKGSLLHSFRSSPAILKTVDAIFETNTTLGSDDPVAHIAFHDDLPGRVDLWPLVSKPDSEGELEWHDSRYRTSRETAPATLARELAARLGELLEKGSIPDKKGESRRIEPRDIMILVQRRSALFDHIIAACKSANLPMAGADRMKIAAELAVRDILALLEFLSLPEDSLSLASALRSPLFGFSEQDLFTLAARRSKKASLWQVLRDRKEDFADTYEALEKLRSKVDYARPFELVETILTDFGGAERLIKRLGNEAEDGINELLNQALDFERSNIPSLTGFLSAARAADAEIKREADSTSNMIRVMTVHGAKGLESPIVVLPDTTFGPRRSSGKLISGPMGIPVVPGSRDEAPPIIAKCIDDKHLMDDAERDRLLYVAMTRSEQWLIVCGVETSGGSKRVNWHEKVEGGLQALGAASIETPTGQGLRFQVGEWSETADRAKVVEDASGAKPHDLTGPPPAPDAQVRLLSPSDLGGAKFIEGSSLDQDAAKQRGRQIHRLLELAEMYGNLNNAETILSHMGADAPNQHAVPDLIAETQGVLSAHSELFQSDGLTEAEISAFVPSLGARISGAIDRLIIKPDRVLAIDFKTNAVVPNNAGEVPEGILRQMGAYLEALESIYADKNIQLAILWTANASLMPLEHGIVREALQRTATS